MQSSAWASVILALACLPACGRGEATRIRIDGSSTVYPLMEAIAEEFHRINGQARVTVGISGTGGGFKKFCGRETDIQDASRPIKPTEIELCRKNNVEFVEIPIAYDGIVIVVNPRNTWATSITTAELGRLWTPEAQGKLTRWSQIRDGWPDREIHLFGAGVDSGTYDYFTEAIVHRQHASRGDYTSSEDDNVLVQGVASDELALAFFSYAYFASNTDKLRAVPVDDGKPENGDGPIAPSPETVRRGTYQPLSRPVFVYTSQKALDKPIVEAYVRYSILMGPSLSSEVGLIPLPERAYDLSLDRVVARRTGTVFIGATSAAGVPIDELLARGQAKPGS